MVESGRDEQLDADVGVPLCSAVIPAFNAATTVGAAVASALSQTEPDVEVIVVDDGSTDTTALVATSVDDRRVRVISQRNGGLPAARNTGIRAARGTYVSFLDSDDLWLPDYLELMVSALRALDGAGLAYTDAYAFDSLTGRVRRRTAMQRMRPPIPPPGDRAGFLLELLERNFIFVATTVPRAVFDAVGLFDEARTSVEDYEMWLRISLAGYPTAWVPGQHALYRTHPGQMSGNAPRMYRNIYDVYGGLDPASMPTDRHREVLAARRLAASRNLEMVSARPPARSAPARGRRVLGRIRKRVGLGEPWYRTPPPDVARAFPDLTAV